jgi:hypothetical protein
VQRFLLDLRAICLELEDTNPLLEQFVNLLQ